MNKMLGSMTPYMKCRMRSNFITHAHKRECISIIDGLFTLVSSTVFFQWNYISASYRVVFYITIDHYVSILYLILYDNNLYIILNYNFELTIINFVWRLDVWVQMANRITHIFWLLNVLYLYIHMFYSSVYILLLTNDVVFELYVTFVWDVLPEGGRNM